MAKAEIGQAVQVELAGLEAPGITFGEGLLGVGKIIGIDSANQKVTVRFDNLSIGAGDYKIVEAPAKKVKLLPADAAVAAGS